MNIREMHIEINQSLQKVAANITRKFLTEEIDWMLNKIQGRFIQECLRPVNFNGNNTGQFRFADQLRTDALKNLVVSQKQLTAYKDSATRVKAFLPGDYAYLLADSSNMVNLCGENRVETSTSIDLTYLDLSKSTAVSSPYYATNNELVCDSVTLTIPGSLSTFNTYTGFQRVEDVVFLKDWLLTNLRREGVEVYWERFGDIYKPWQFIFVGTPALSLTWDNLNVTLTSSATLTLTSQDTAKSVTHTADNRLVNSFDVYTLQNSPFYSTTIKSPISELNNNTLYVYQDNNTTVKSVTISYVRIPQTMSLPLGMNCELTEQFHQTLCDLTVEYIKGLQENLQGQAAKRQDIETRVII